MTDRDSDKNNAAKAQHELIGVKSDSETNQKFVPTNHPDAQWFENAGMGLFIHWGISSVHGGVDISWGMMANTTWDAKANNKNKITPNEYYRLAEEFKPDMYNPDKWIEAASRAGFKYAVLTTKHHDGFALWPSNFGELSTKNYLDGIDLVKMFVDSCRKFNIKVGLYYSPPDWYYNRKYMSFNYGSDEYYKREDPEFFKDRKPFGMNHEIVEIPEKPKNWDENYKLYIKNQVEELLTRYGKIDIIWFDGGPDAISINRIRELQPGILVNPRMHGYGDFKTPEVTFPSEKIQGRWELCLMWNKGGWGYTKPEIYMPTSWIIDIVVKAKTWGGNVLINCAPRPNGEMPELYYEKMTELSEWIKYNRDSLVDAESGPYPEQCNFPVTINKNKWYIHIIDSDSKTIEINNGKDLLEAYVLDTEEKLEHKFDGNVIYISCPKYENNNLHKVVCVKWD